MMRVTTLRAKRMSTRCQYEQRSCAAELIDAKDCAICMVHFTSDESCGVTCFPVLACQVPAPHGNPTSRKVVLPHQPGPARQTRGCLALLV